MKSVLFILFCGLQVSVFAQSDSEGLIMKSIFFGGGRWDIDTQQEQELIDFLDGFPNIEHYEISVHGHTDNIGSVSYNQWLSEMRSNEVLLILKEYGLLLDNIEVDAFGELAPAFDNSSFDGQLSNRRVDVILKPIIL